MRDDGPNGALARGLAVLAALNNLTTPSVSRIVEETRLPKPTVIRLLRTLCDQGFVQQDAETQVYSATARVLALSRSRRGREEAEQLIQTELDALGSAIKWPVEYLVPDGLTMQILCNNRAKAPIKLKLFERLRLPMHESAAGIAYLSRLRTGEVAPIVERLGSDDAMRGALLRRISLARRNGYARRQLPELGKDMAVVSVAVSGVGALSLVYLQDIVSLEQFTGRLLPALEAAAARIRRISPAASIPLA